METYLALNTPQVDWVTVTTYDREIYVFWRKLMDKQGFDGREAREMQYRGIECQMARGSMRVMSGLQGMHDHYMIKITSGLAQDYLGILTGQYNQGVLNPTRIDVQVTVPYPDGWSQFEMLYDLKVKRGKRVKWDESEDYRTKEALETVGIGSRGSDRYTRIYTKMTAKDRALRFEVEYKGERAKAAMRLISGELEVMGGMLKNEIKRIKYQPMWKVFKRPLEDSKETRVKVYKVTSEGRTDDWLMSQCLPVLRRRLRDSSQSATLWDAYQRVLAEVTPTPAQQEER